ncbi:GTP cyclohydrolase II-domain-containing protein [Cristinia sonorae]|uniref:GTP cyclohydrolase II n=1 Tax=Cristinia sonorae TaxID=1940300 RepID=A0A8K0UJU8_9AGAR|nr:GTP cyclohydrolase II-domain-containing protein [Cristinia sonorae]
MHHQDQCECCGLEEDLALLDMLTAPSPPVFTGRYKRRDSELDPLMIAAAAASGPHVTRNHYAHDFYPAVGDPLAEGAYDWTKWQAQTSKDREQRRPRLKYVSRQAPRSQRLGLQRVEEKENGAVREITDPLRDAGNLPTASHRDPQSSSHAETNSITSSTTKATTSSVSTTSQGSTPPPLEVKCMARTRVPTPHGPVFLHLYHNNRDNKEHLAIVVDPAQLDAESPAYAPAIRSASLDAIWSETETEMDRITRGAYVGRLSAASQKPSSPSAAQPTIITDTLPSPLIRIHSECFTGETIGSMRCDCGEQLDEAIRQIAQPIRLSALSATAAPITIPGRGAVIYMRQEGRGIGLLSKIRAYNLQDLGHDTVTANLMLGHKADERGYEIAGAILRDLGLGSETGEGVRLLTNNPDKVQALQEEGVRIVERVPMVPRSWQSRRHDDDDVHIVTPGEEVTPKGATMIGGGAVYGDDLEKYLRTKVLRMGHMLPLLGEDGLLHKYH